MVKLRNILIYPMMAVYVNISNSKVHFIVFPSTPAHQIPPIFTFIFAINPKQTDTKNEKTERSIERAAFHSKLLLFYL